MRLGGVMKKFRIYLVLGIVFFLTAVFYFGGNVILAEKGLEYRTWVELTARALLWCIPFLLAVILFWQGIKRMLLQGEKTASGFLLGGFVLFIILGTLATVFVWLTAVPRIKTESQMPDGNLVVTVQDWYGGSRPYYAEPVGIIARKEFSWDSEHYAKSLSKIYNTEFTAAWDDSLGAVYHSEDYPGLDVQVWGVGYHKDDYLQENLQQLVTGAELDRKGKEFFRDAVELTEHEVEMKQDYDGKDCYTVTSLTVYWDRMDEAAEKIALFIREELSDAKRADGEKLWDNNMTGTVIVNLKFSPHDREPYCFYIPFKSGEENFWSFGEDVTADEVKECLEREFSTHRNTRSSSPNDVSGEADSGEEPDKEAPEPYMQSDYHQVNDGFVAIYAHELSDEKDSRFLTDEDAKGNQEAIIYEDDKVVRFLRFDRTSDNGKCLLYVYYEADKYEDGSYSPTEARILDMFAYVIETGEVISSGKTTWSDVGTKEYRDATGE